MKQETLEEAIENEIKNIYLNSANLENIAKYSRINGTLLLELKKCMTNIAKWQAERMYSEEEVLELLMKFEYYPTMYKGNSESEVKEWFEQFKKK